MVNCFAENILTKNIVCHFVGDFLLYVCTLWKMAETFFDFSRLFGGSHLIRVFFLQIRNHM